MNDIPVGKEFSKLMTFKSTKPITIGAAKTPGREWVLLDEDGNTRIEKTLNGSLPEESLYLAKTLKDGDKFVIIKRYDGKWWNIVAFNDASTYKPKPKWNGGGQRDGEAATVGMCFKIAYDLYISGKREDFNPVDDTLQLCKEFNDILKLYKDSKVSQTEQEDCKPGPDGKNEQPAGELW